MPHRPPFGVRVPIRTPPVLNDVFAFAALAARRPQYPILHSGMPFVHVRVVFVPWLGYLALRYIGYAERPWGWLARGAIALHPFGSRSRGRLRSRYLCSLGSTLSSRPLNIQLACDDMVVLAMTEFPAHRAMFTRVELALSQASLCVGKSGLRVSAIFRDFSRALVDFMIRHSTAI